MAALGRTGFDFDFEWNWNWSFWSVKIKSRKCHQRLERLWGLKRRKIGLKIEGSDGGNYCFDYFSAETEKVALIV